MIQDFIKNLLDNPPPEGELLRVLEEAAPRLNTTFFYLKKAYYEKRNKAKKEGKLSVKPDAQSSSEYEFNGDGATFKCTTTKRIKTLEEALAVCDADMSAYEVENWGVKTWDTSMKLTHRIDGKITHEEPHIQTNYSVWIKFKPKDRTQEYLDRIEEQVLSWESSKPQVKKGSGVGVINLADFHIGADIKELLRTLDFDINILQDRLAQIAAQVNSKGYKEVHVNMVGDFIESFTGLNHLNSWRSMDKKMIGANIVIVATRIIANFLSSINNLVCVNMVAGNHDRSTPDSKIDNMGEIAGILAYTLGLTIDVEIDYHPFLISKDIDGMHYVIYHGDKAMAGKDAAKILFEYGDNSKYNILMSGHLHTRKTEKTYKRQFYTYETVQVVSMDDLNYRKLVLPPLFTGNHYSETLGFASNPGYVDITNNGNGRPIVTDYSS